MDGLGINEAALIAQIINFGILLILLRMFAYKPVMKMLDQRAARIKESMDEVETVKKRAEEADSDAAKRIEEASQEGQRIIKQAMEAGEAAKAKAKQEAKIEAQSLVEKAKVEIQRERNEAVEELRKEVSDLAIMAAGKVISHSMDKEEHRKVINDILREAPGLQNN
ncbi:F0F1 ATP synthase subunit B [Chloroflexota bacterium]